MQGDKIQKIKKTKKNSWDISSAGNISEEKFLFRHLHRTQSATATTNSKPGTPKASFVISATADTITAAYVCHDNSDNRQGVNGAHIKKFDFAVNKF